MEQQENIFENLVGSFKKALNKLPGLVGKEALHFIADNFAKQGFMGETFRLRRVFFLGFCVKQK